MSQAAYQVDTHGDIALAAATAKTIMSVINAANALIRITAFHVGFDGVSSTAEPVTVELCYSTQGAAGTSSSHTPNQVRGSTRTVQATAAYAYTAGNEPTTLTTWFRWMVHPQSGLTMQFPLGREPECIVTADALCIRCTAPASVNVQGFMEWEEG